MAAVPLPPAARVLMVMMSALGDTVHVLPVVTALKRHDPTLHITWVLEPGPASLVRGHPDVDDIILFHRKAGWRAFPGIRRALAGRRFDLVINLQVYAKGTAVTALARAPIKLGFDRARARDANWLVTNRKVPPHAPQHVQDQYFEFLDTLGVPYEPVAWNLGPWPHEREMQRAFLGTLSRPAASLVIGSTRAEKDWVPERWAHLADALYERHGLQPVIVGGRSERELETEREIMRHARHPIVSTLGVPLRELVAIFDASALVVTLDTGPMHMAVALNAPTIALVGFFNPKRIGPYRRFRDLLVDAYGDPGEDYPVSMDKRPGRTAVISVQQVLEGVDVWSAKYRSARLAHIDRLTTGWME